MLPILMVEQPDVLFVNDAIRLRKFDGVFDFALDWYQDEETLMLVDGVYQPYTMERLSRMYMHLDQQGELYFIEVRENHVFIPIGDVTFSREDMPIVIGVAAYRGRGIGRKVVTRLIERGRQLGYSSLGIREIYSHNQGSQQLFQSVGFQKCERTEKGHRYKLVL